MPEENPYAPPVAHPSAVPQRRAYPDLDTGALKKLRNNSHTIRTLGALSVLAALAGPAVIYYGLENLSIASLGLGLAFFGFFGLVTYCSWWRPSWGRIPGFIYCVLALPSIPIGTAIGILGLIAYGQGRELFGRERYLHKELEAEWKHRKRHGIA